MKRGRPWHLEALLPGLLNVECGWQAGPGRGKGEEKVNSTHHGKRSALTPHRACSRDLFYTISYDVDNPLCYLFLGFPFTPEQKSAQERSWL